MKPSVSAVSIYTYITTRALPVTVSNCPHTYMLSNGEEDKTSPMWYGIVEFNVPLDTVQVISETTTLSSAVHLPFSNGGPAT